LSNNKNNNIYNINNNIFVINTLNYKTNNNVYDTYFYIKKLKNIYNTNYLGPGEDPSELGALQDPLPLGPALTLLYWVHCMTHYHWVLMQSHLQDNPSARSRHVARRFGCASLVSQRHVMLGSHQTQGQTAQAPDVPTWWCRFGSCLGQGKPAPAPRGARSDSVLGQGSPNTLNIIIFIIIEVLILKIILFML
jgi:hypothetical protein